MSGNVTELITFSDIFFGDEWNVNRTIAFMALWVPTSFKTFKSAYTFEIIAYLKSFIAAVAYFQIAIAYLAMVYFGQKMMRNQTAFELDRLLAVWNFAFSIFSAIAAYHLIPELIWSLKNLGFVGKIQYFEALLSTNQWNVLTMGTLMYLSYLYLFVEFFYKAYIVKKPQQSQRNTIADGELPEKKTFLPANERIQLKKDN
ncbi:unnamed protein product [Anisakis simplex]|uniref:Elongation of very long chain fatty acids protein n=1 Tax=Anisakis simplex TaxID=6269 RepID=A0A0M3K0X1_ANISI|nr:unnamed protein product [Anisakis simplex]